MSTILIVEDDLSLQEALNETIRLAGFETKLATDGYEALTVLERVPVDMIVSDVAMSGMDGHRLLKEVKKRHPNIPMLLMTAYADIEQAVQAIRSGAVDYLVKPFEPKALIKIINRVVGIPSEEPQTHIAVSQSSKLLFIKARKVSNTAATALITGESGTGKEVLARYIHQQSPRKDKPFIAINCAAIPENMLEATLFGYEKGAFTGAYQASPGKFEQAEGGTLLLDEITEMDLGLQAKLLRVIQEREVERLGSKKTFKLDVRIIATSNRDLKQAVSERKFREDLFYRINVFPLHTTPLREREEDIIPLARHLLEVQAEKMQVADVTFGPGCENKLISYHWPGNVRELDNVIQRGLILQSGATIEVGDIEFEAGVSQSPAVEAEQSTSEANTEPFDPQDNLKKREFTLILDELRLNSGCRKKTAEQLGISPRTLRYKLAKMREMGMTVPATRGQALVKDES